MEEALKDYNRAIELVPSAADPHLNRGAVYESMGRLEEALKDYDVVLFLDTPLKMVHSSFHVTDFFAPEIS